MPPPGGTEIEGIGFTVTVIVPIPVQPAPLVPITVYVVVLVGLAVTEDPVVAERPVDGDHEYEVAPETLSPVLPPLQIATDGLVVRDGVGFTETVVVAVAVQPKLL